MLLELPREVLYYILTFLDIPDLNNLSAISPVLREVASDAGLHRLRVHVTTPSRINHSLFSDDNIRPTIPDLIQRGVMSGVSLHARWRFGLYLYSDQSVKSYWSIRRINTAFAKRSVNNMLQTRSSSSFGSNVRITPSMVLPDFKPGIPTHISSNLFPIMRVLKWKLLRDQVAKIHRDVGRKHLTQDWLENTVRSYPEHERLRLAVCPDVRKLTLYFERLARQ